MGRHSLARFLAETLDIALPTPKSEYRIGDFRADIVCSDPEGRSSVIENQFGRSDHKHLGQLMTYAADPGLNVTKIIWIAEESRPEHKAAIDWLNEWTKPDIDFFAVAIRVLRIGTEKAPEFTVVARPDYASGTKRMVASDLQKIQVDFWTALKEYLEKRKSPYQFGHPQATHSVTFRTLGPGVRLCGVIRGGREREIGVGIATEGLSSRAIYDALESKRVEIENEVGEALKWHPNEHGKQMCRIELVWPSDVRDREKWPDHFQRIERTLKLMESAFQNRVPA